MEVREYEYLPLVQIQACSAVEAGHPIFDSLLVYENAPMESKVLSNAQQLNVAGSTSRTHTNYPLTVVIYPGDELGLHLSYDQSYFDEPTIAALLEDFRRLLLALPHFTDERPASLTEVAALLGVERDVLLADLQAMGIEAVLDDRGLRPGAMFADIELIGIPHRVVVSERGLAAGTFEYRARRATDAENIGRDELLARLRG